MVGISLHITFVMSAKLRLTFVMPAIACPAHVMPARNFDVQREAKLGSSLLEGLRGVGAAPRLASAKRRRSEFACRKAACKERDPRGDYNRFGVPLKEISLRRNFFEKSERTFCRIYATCPRKRTSVP